MAWPCHPARAGQQSGAQCGLGSVSSGQGSGKRVRRRHPREPEGCTLFWCVGVSRVGPATRLSLGRRRPPPRQWRASVPRMCCAHHGANVAHALRASATTQKAARPSRRLARCCTVQRHAGAVAPEPPRRLAKTAREARRRSGGCAGREGDVCGGRQLLWRPQTTISLDHHSLLLLKVVATQSAASSDGWRLLV